jgi:hypothetical protein
VFSILDEATISEAAAARENEVRRLLTEREARQEERSVQPRRWRWRVEPGKEEQFEHLRGWLLRSQREDLVEIATPGRETYVNPPDSAPKMSAEYPRVRCRRQGPASRRRLSLVLGTALLASRAFPRLGRRLLQWGDASRAR